jgi:hypothetical protein
MRPPDEYWRGVDKAIYEYWYGMFETQTKRLAATSSLRMEAAMSPFFDVIGNQIDQDTQEKINAIKPNSR